MEVKRFVDCSDERSREVCDKIEAVVRGSVAVYENITEEERFRLIDMGIFAYRWLDYEFYDRSKNIRRWLSGQPCIFCNDLQGIMMEIDIGRDYNALYEFLEFCRHQNSNVEVSNEYLDYMEYLASIGTPLEKNAV